VSGWSVSDVEMGMALPRGRVFCRVRRKEGEGGWMLACREMQVGSGSGR
jgi:hypothetical protein